MNQSENKTSKINVEELRSEISNFKSLNLKKIFIEYLGWENPGKISTQPITVSSEKGDISFDIHPIAQLAGIYVFNLKSDTDSLPNDAVLKEAHGSLNIFAAEYFIIFTDKFNNQCWYWTKIDKDNRGKNKTWHRKHYLLRGQTAELFVSKILNLYADIDEYDIDGNLKGGISKVDEKLRSALDVDRVIKKFYGKYQRMHLDFADLIKGIDHKRDREWYAGVLLNRLMFIYFLQKKGFIDNQNYHYLFDKLKQSKEKDLYYSNFLRVLFFEGFARPEKDRSPETRKLIGKIAYLNGGLFLPHRLELSELSEENTSGAPDNQSFNENLFIPDSAFENAFKLFESYSWNLNDLSDGKDDEMNPDVLGYIFEKYINQKEFGAYYTKPEITEYLCEETIYPYLLNQINHPAGANIPERAYETIEDMLMNADANLIKELIGLTEKGHLDTKKGILTRISILDPACGSGAFLVAALKKLINIYNTLYDRIDQVNDSILTEHKKQIRNAHPSISYYIKKRVINDNLYGVDINAEAVEIARLRLFIYLVASVQKVEELEPLPNIDFNLMAGNSLVGLLNVNDIKGNAFVGFNDNSLHKTPKLPGKKEPKAPTEDQGLANDPQAYFRKLIIQKENLINAYKDSEKILDPSAGETLLTLREKINQQRRIANTILNNILLNQMDDLKIKYEKSTWDESKNKEGKTIKQPLSIHHITELNPFHWGFEFHNIMQSGGFDLLLGNPPWEVLQAEEKEFFQKYESTIQKNKLRIEDWKTNFGAFMANEELREAWFKHSNLIRLYSIYLKKSPQYPSIEKGKINLYAYFTEQFYNLLKINGFCGIVIPSGIYTDLGTKGLRELLFTRNQVKGLFCFENRNEIFESVHRSFKFITLVFEKGGPTNEFRAAFMRHDPEDLELFRQKKLGLTLTTDLIKRLSSESFSVMEIKNDREIGIVEKMLEFPFLGEKIEGSWNIKLSQEFNMTTDSHLFRTEPGPGRLPLYEGKMIHQFRHDFAKPRYWVDEAEGRKAVLGKTQDKGQKLDYQEYRLAYRSIARGTDKRTLIMSILPKNIFTGNSLNIDIIPKSNEEKLNVLYLLNSLVIDFHLRSTVSANLNTHYIYQLPIPRLSSSHPEYPFLVKSAARLVCTDELYAPLWEEVMGEKWLPEKGITDEQARMRLRAEMDARVAHIYGLTDEEFEYILSTFPAVETEHKEWAMKYFKE